MKWGIMIFPRGQYCKTQKSTEMKKTAEMYQYLESMPAAMHKSMSGFNIDYKEDSY